MGDRGHNRHGPKRGEGLLCLFRTAGTPSKTMWPGPRSTSVPSGVFIHEPFDHNRHDFKLIATVKTETRHPVDRPVDSEFPSICNRCGVWLL